MTYEMETSLNAGMVVDLLSGFPDKDWDGNLYVNLYTQDDKPGLVPFDRITFPANATDKEVFDILASRVQDYVDGNGEGSAIVEIEDLYEGRYPEDQITGWSDATYYKFLSQLNVDKFIFAPSFNEDGSLNRDRLAENRISYVSEYGLEDMEPLVVVQEAEEYLKKRGFSVNDGKSESERSLTDDDAVTFIKQVREVAGLPKGINYKDIDLSDINDWGKYHPNNKDEWASFLKNTAGIGDKNRTIGSGIGKDDIEIMKKIAAEDPALGQEAFYLLKSGNYPEAEEVLDIAKKAKADDTGKSLVDTLNGVEGIKNVSYDKKYQQICMELDTGTYLHGCGFNFETKDGIQTVLDDLINDIETMSYDDYVFENPFFHAEYDKPEDGGTLTAECQTEMKDLAAEVKDNLHSVYNNINEAVSEALLEQKPLSKDAVTINSGLVISSIHTTGTGTIDGEPFEFDWNRVTDNITITDSSDKACDFLDKHFDVVEQTIREKAVKTDKTRDREKGRVIK